LKYVHDVLIYS